eukprot:5669978-Amphidinium_carterae.1
MTWYDCTHYEAPGTLSPPEPPQKCKMTQKRLKNRGWGRHNARMLACPLHNSSCPCRLEVE